MNVWLCPVKPKSWRPIKTAKIFGAPRHASKTMRHVKPGDLLVFHVLKPINGIIAVCKVTAEDIKNLQIKAKVVFLNACQVSRDDMAEAFFKTRKQNRRYYIAPRKDVPFDEAFMLLCSFIREPSSKRGQNCSVPSNMYTT